MTTLPPGWGEATLSEVVGPGLFVDGDWIETKDQDPDGDVRLVQLADIGEGEFRDRSSRYLTSATATRLNCTMLQAGDILVARMPDPLGRACRVPELRQEAVTAVDVCVLRPTQTGVDPDWLMWILNAPQARSQVAALQSGTTRKRVSRKNLATIRLPVPPRAEQERIVLAIEEDFSRLSAATTSIARAQRLVAQLTSAVVEMPFRSGKWDWVPLGDLARRIRGVTFRKTEAANDEEEGFLPVVRAGNIRDSELCTSEDLVWVPSERVSPEQLLAEGDILVATSSGSAAVVGKSALVQQSWRGAHGAFLTLLRPHGRVSPAFLSYWLQTNAVRRAWSKAAAGTNINNLKVDDLQQTLVPVAALAEQERVVTAIREHFDTCDRLRAQLVAAETRALGLQRSILSAAFSGKLVPQDPGDEPASVLLERIRAERGAAAPTRRRQKAPTA